MKLFGAILFTAAFAVKSVPTKTPLERMEQLQRHITRLMADHLSCHKKVGQWESKMNGVCDRAVAAYTRNDRPCSFFDDGVEHGGPEPEEEDEELRYNELDAIASINGITSGMRKWSQRYLAACGGQKNNDHLVNHANKWRKKLTAKFNAGC